MTIQEKEQKIAAVMRDKSTPLPLRARAIERIHDEFKAATMTASGMSTNVDISKTDRGQNEGIRNR